MAVMRMTPAQRKAADDLRRDARARARGVLLRGARRARRPSKERALLPLSRRRAQIDAEAKRVAVGLPSHIRGSWEEEPGTVDRGNVDVMIGAINPFTGKPFEKDGSDLVVPAPTPPEAPPSAKPLPPPPVPGGEVAVVGPRRGASHGDRVLLVEADVAAVASLPAALAPGELCRVDAPTMDVDPIPGETPTGATIPDATWGAYARLSRCHPPERFPGEPEPEPEARLGGDLRGLLTITAPTDADDPEASSTAPVVASPPRSGHFDVRARPSAEDDRVVDATARLDGLGA